MNGTIIMENPKDKIKRSPPSMLPQAKKTSEIKKPDNRRIKNIYANTAIIV
jgi:hypothetical protein